jgi:hypothetical protein
LGHVDAGALQLGTQEFDLATPIWISVLRDRNDRDRGITLRHRAIRRRSFPSIAAPSRPDDCSISGGPFKQGYNVLKGIDRYIPVDVYIPGCPPRPEALLHAFMELQRKIDSQKLSGANKAEFLKPEQPSEFPVPEFGEHDLNPPANKDVYHPPKLERV